jgi:periplasmic protein CpxP/Spy
MKNIQNKLFVATSLIFLCSFAGNTMAQQGRGPGRQFTEEDIIKRVERLSETLDLSEEQEAQLLKIELKDFNSRQDMRGQFQGDREAMRAKMQERRAEKEKKYAEILTKEQMTKWEELREQRRRDFQNKNQIATDSTRKPRGRSR